MVGVKDPRPVDCDVVAELRNRQAALRTSRGGLGIGRVGRRRAVGCDFGEHCRLRLEVVLGVQEVFESRVDLEPHVIVAVVFVRDVYRYTLGVLARVEHREAVGIVDAGLGGAGPAAGGQLGWRRLRDTRALCAAAQQENGNRRQRRKAGTQPNRDSANGPGPDTIT